MLDLFWPARQWEISIEANPKATGLQGTCSRPVILFAAIVQSRVSSDQDQSRR